jgi:hypothetical protein
MIRYNPGTLQHHKWENAMTLDRRSWGNRRDMNLGRYKILYWEHLNSCADKKDLLKKAHIQSLILYKLLK